MARASSSGQSEFPDAKPRNLRLAFAEAVLLGRGLMTDEEWTFFAQFAIAKVGNRGRPPDNHRRVMNVVFWIGRTGTLSCSLPEYYRYWWLVFRQYRRGHRARGEGIEAGDAERQRGSAGQRPVDRLHNRVGAPPGGWRKREGHRDGVWAARRAASRPTSTPMPRDYRPWRRSPARKSPTTNVRPNDDE